jgi:hypothetical protein
MKSHYEVWGQTTLPMLMYTLLRLDGNASPYLHERPSEASRRS